MRGDLTYLTNQYFGDESKAAFANAEFDINSQFTISGGVRYEKQDSTLETLSDGPLAGGAPSQVTADNGSGVVAPKGGVDWKLDDQTLVYFSAAKGYRPGGAESTTHLNVPACIAQLAALGNPKGYKSDSLWSYEIGAKRTMLDHRLSIDGSIYYIDWSNIISAIHIPACATHVASNLGNAKSQGFDLSIKALLTQNWSAGLYVGYTDAQYTTNSTLFGETTARSGQAVSDISPWNVTVEAGYQAHLSGTVSWYGHIENRYNSRNNKIVPAEDPTIASYDPDRENQSIGQSAQCPSGTALCRRRRRVAVCHQYAQRPPGVEQTRWPGRHYLWCVHYPAAYLRSVSCCITGRRDRPPGDHRGSRTRPSPGRGC